MKFSFYTDIHLTDNIPCHRTDNYIQTLCNKLISVYQLSDNNDCECVCFGGDMFDRHKIYSYNVINQVIATIQESKLKTYACCGEHDLYGHNPLTFPDSALSFVTNHASNLNILWNPVHLENGVSFYAKHEWQKMEDLDKIELDPKRYNVLLCHELLYNKKMPFSITNTADLDLKFDLVCSGDLHCGYKPHKVKNTWYCNPGSLARKTIADVKRMPKILFIEVRKNFEPVIREQILPGFKGGREVLEIGIAETVRKFESKIDMNEFIKGFENLEQEKMNIFDLFDEFKNRVEVKKDVIDYIESLKNKRS